MADPKSRARVERLLSGNIRPDDLTHLFLYARDRCDGRESVQEIGDFVAHHDERIKGIVTRTVREFFAIARFFAPRFVNAVPPPIDPQNLPSTTPDFLKACFTRLDQSTIKAHTGLSKARAYKVLDGLVRSLRMTPSGGFAIHSVTREEAALFDCLASRMVIRPAFGGDRLFDDLRATFKSNGLITKSELQEAAVFKPAVQLFAASIMHNSAIRMVDGSIISIRAHPRRDGIEVCADVPVHNTEQRQLSFSSGIFITGLSPDEFCEPNLREMPDWSAVEIELSPNGKLTVL